MAPAKGNDDNAIIDAIERYGGVPTPCAFAAAQAAQKLSVISIDVLMWFAAAQAAQKLAGAPTLGNHWFAAAQAA
ncbi:hypothetical protein [uncultured Kushneria sp.]|uniref:hypothetical protein n=1 Tax=uncultured Kushneria sp. TaxID=905033 RepID=UPI0026176B67|nr:hypothetical protein [uncultured Kushneria sp.]